MRTQNERLKEMMASMWVTPLDAMQFANCARLAARVLELRQRGVAIVWGKFRAHINVNGRTLVIGRYDSAEAARDAYVDAKLRLHSGAVRERLVA